MAAATPPAETAIQTLWRDPRVSGRKRRARGPDAPPRSPSEIRADLLRRFEGGTPRDLDKAVNGRHCVRPVMIYTSACDLAIVARTGPQPDVYDECQRGLRALLARSPGVDWDYRASARWYQNVFEYAGLAVAASNLQPNFFHLRAEDAEPIRNDAWCSGTVGPSAGCAKRDPSNSVVEADQFSAYFERIQAEVKASGSKLKIIPQFPTIDMGLAIGQGVYTNKRKAANYIYDNLIFLPRYFRTSFPIDGIAHFGYALADALVQKERFTVGEDDVKRVKALAKDPYAWVVETFRYSGRTVVSPGTFFGSSGDYDEWASEETKRVAVPGAGMLIEYAKYVAQVVLSRSLAERAAIAVKFYLNNHLVYFIERGEMKLDRSKLAKARQAAADASIEAYAGMQAGTAALVPPLALAALIYGIVGAPVLKFFFGDWIAGRPTCPQPLYLRMVDGCDVEQLLVDEAERLLAGEPPTDTTADADTGVASWVQAGLGLAGGAILGAVVVKLLVGR